MAPGTELKTYGANAKRHPAVTWSRMKLKWPMLVWILAVITTAVMFKNNVSFRHLSGIVQVTSEEIASLETARIQKIHVVVGQAVTNGQILVEMDTSLLDAEMDVERIQMGRQFSLLIQRQEESLRVMRIELAQSKAELAVIADEVKRLEDLSERRLIDVQTVAGIKAREEGLKSVVKLYPEAIKDVEQKLEANRLQQEDLINKLSDDSVGDIEGERLGLLKLRRDNHVLRASRDGHVSRLYKETSEVVAAGEVMLTVVTPKPAYVLGFLPESNIGDVLVGMAAEVSLHPGRTGLYSRRQRHQS